MDKHVITVTYGKAGQNSVPKAQAHCSCGHWESKRLADVTTATTQGERHVEETFIEWWNEVHGSPPPTEDGEFVWEASEAWNLWTSKRDVEPTCINRTDREVWVGQPRIQHYILWSIERAGQRDDVSAGLRALAEAWFDHYTDEVNLPAWFNQAVEFADEALGDLDLPNHEDES
jgi:hypothetical protein